MPLSVRYHDLGVLSTGSTLNPAVAEEQPPPEHEHDDQPLQVAESGTQRVAL